MASGSELPDAPVGVRVIRNDFGAPVRIFYPCELSKSSNHRPASWFRTSFASVMQGHMHVFGGQVHKLLAAGSFIFSLIAACVDMIFHFFFPAPVLPHCYENAPVASPKDRDYFPLLIWSHGLTGTGDENAYQAVKLASYGMVVAIVQHSDGSSSKVDIVKDGVSTVMFYEHPDYSNYDDGHRQRGCEHRAAEVENTRKAILAGVGDLSKVLRADKVAVGGYSFGAATASLVACEHEKDYKCVVLHDGWFHIELKSKGVNIDLPKQAHEKGLRIPALFLNSTAFDAWKSWKAATERLLSKCDNHRVQVIPDTVHGNFMELSKWFPRSFVTKAGFSTEEADPHKTYDEIIRTSAEFILEHVHEDK